MRSVTYRLSSTSGYYDMWGLQDAGIPLQSIHDIDLRSDGSLSMLFQTSAPPDRLRSVAERHLGSVIDWDVAAGAEATRLHVHCEPSAQLCEAIALYRQYPVLTDYPIEYVTPGESTVRVVKVGAEADLNGFIDALSEDVDLTVEQVGPYDPGSDRVFGALTERQKTVLRTAIERGYYDVPREASCEELAAELNCSPGTVSQHLRRIESTVLSAFVDTAAQRVLGESGSA